MATKDPRIDAYIREAAPFARPILNHIRAAVHAGCPDLDEDMKWNAPHFMYKGMLCGMAAFKQHCAFGFWKGALLDGQGSAQRKGRYDCIKTIADLPSKKELIALVRQAARLNDDGVKVPRRAAAKTAAAQPVPPVLMAALRGNRKALGTFEGFSPSHRREYVEWIAEAKTDATRARRVATAVEWLAEGKSRNWKYT